MVFVSFTNIYNTVKKSIKESLSKDLNYWLKIFASKYLGLSMYKIVKEKPINITIL